MKNRVDILIALRNILPTIGVDIKEGIKNIARFPKSQGSDPFKPNFLDGLREAKGTLGDARKGFQENAKYIMSEGTEGLLNFYNNIQDYIARGGVQKFKKEGELVDLGTGKPMTETKTQALEESLGLPEGVEPESPMGGMMSTANRLKVLVDEIEGITPEMRARMNKEELQNFIKRMEEKNFPKSIINNMFDEYGEYYSVDMLKEEVAPRLKIAVDLGAKTPGEAQFIKDLEEMKEGYRPYEFREKLTDDYIIGDIRQSIRKDLERTGKFTEEEIDDLIYPNYGKRPTTPFEYLEKMEFQLIDEPKNFKLNKQFYENALQKYVYPAKRQYPAFKQGGLVNLFQERD